MAARRALDPDHYRCAPLDSGGDEKAPGITPPGAEGCVTAWESRRELVARPVSHVFLDHRAQLDRLVLRVSGRQGGRPQWKVYNVAYLASMARPEGHFILVRNAVRP
jgi:hypothetical protein